MMMANCIDAWEDCFTFFKGKSPYHTTRHTMISHFSRNQKVAWKLSCALVVFIFSVFFPSLTLSWEGYTADGIEKTPPLMLFGPATALLAVLSLWIAAVHLYQPTFNGPRILLHYRRPAPCSWEMLDWVFFESSTTATFVSFVYFWIVTIPYSVIQLQGIHILSTTVMFVVVMVDFYFTAPMFRANHVFLALLWPAFWLFVQYLWVVGGHQPGNNLFNFHTVSAIFSALGLLAGTVVAFYLLRWYSARLQWLSDQAGKSAGSRSVSGVSLENSGYVTPPCEDESAAQFELMVDSGTRSPPTPSDASRVGGDDQQQRRKRAQ